MAEDDVLLPGMAPEREDDDDLQEDQFALFGMDLDGMEAPIELDGDGGGDGRTTVTTVGSNSTANAPSAAGVASTGTAPTSGGPGKRKSLVWADFDEVFEEIDGVQICTKAICKICKQTMSARSSAGTGHLIRHQKACKEKLSQRTSVQSRLALSADGLRNWEYSPEVARTELCRLIARLDLPLSVGYTDAWEEYIQRAHNPYFKKVSPQATTRDLTKLFDERRKLLKNHVLAGASSVTLTSDIWSGNAKEDYITVVAHYVFADWDLQKKVIGLRLIDCKHTGDNIAERIGGVIKKFGLIEKVFSVTLDNASSNSKAMNTLNILFGGYLGADIDPNDPDNVKYSLIHQRCACHIINLIVKSGLKRFKPYLEDFRVAINFLNSSNHRIALFKNYCIAQEKRPRKFGLDMDVRWNSTYLMLLHLIEYKDVFSVFINSNYGSELLTPSHWHIAKQIFDFLEVFYDCTVALSGVYYPTSALVLHHLLDIASHLHNTEKDPNLFSIIYPMKVKYLKYWKDIPMLYAIAFVLDPRRKLGGLHGMLVLFKEATDVDYSSYYDDVKTELYKLYAKYERKFGTVRQQRHTQPASVTGKRKQAWGRIFGGSGNGLCSSSSASPSPVMSELSAYLDSDRVTEYGDDFDLLLWWRDHKLTFPILSIMTRDIMSVPVSTTSSESCFSLAGRVLEERRRRLLPEHVEMLICIKDWELGDRRLQHDAIDQELVDAFDNMYLDQPGQSGATGEAVEAAVTTGPSVATTTTAGSGSAPRGGATTEGLELGVGGRGTRGRGAGGGGTRGRGRGAGGAVGIGAAPRGTPGPGARGRGGGG